MTEQDIKDFIRSEGWQELSKELEERRQMIINLLIKGGDKDWTDDMMRGRISELEYLQTAPEAMLRDKELTRIESELQKNADSEKEI